MSWTMRIITVILSALIFVLPFNTVEPSNGAPAKARVGTLVVVGDSIVQGVGTSDPDHLSWPARIGAVRTGSAGGCVISACFGQRSMIDQFDSAVLPLLNNESTLVVAYGINDIAAGQYSAAQIVDGLANLYYRARAVGARVYVQTLIPMGPRMWFMDAARREVNDLIRTRFPNVIDMEPTLLNTSNGMIWSAANSGDDLHPNAEGYRRMAAVVRARLGLAA